MIGRIDPVESVYIVQSGVDCHRAPNGPHIPSGQTGGIRVVAVDLDLLETLRGSVAAGTFLNEATARYPAVVLGQTSAERLGIARTGVAVWLGGEWFTVVGILGPIELAPDLDAAAMIGLPVAGRPVRP